MKQLRLLKYLRPHPRDLIVIVSTMVLMIALEVLQPWPIKIMVDQVLGQQPVPESLQEILNALPGPSGVQGLLLWVCIGTVLMFAASTLMAMVHTRAAVRLGQRTVYALGAELFLHLQRLSLRFHAARSVGDLIARVMRDSYCMHSLVLEALLPVLHSVAMLVAMFIIMWQLDSTLTLVSLGVVPFLILSIKIFASPMEARSREHRDLEGTMTSLVHQTLTAIPAVQAFTREELEHARFQTTATQALAAYQRSIATDMWFKLFVGFITAMIVLSAVVAMVPGIPVIGLLVGVQVVNGVLLPVNLFFIWRLSRNEELMGEHRNRGALDLLAAVTVAVTSSLSIALVVVTILGL